MTLHDHAARPLPLPGLLSLALGCIVALAPAPVEASAVATATASAPAASASATAAAATPVACRFGAFVQADDRAGLDVRSAPGLASRVLGTLPPTFQPPGDERLHVRVEVDVTGRSGDWLHIANARDNTGLTDRAARPMFAGDGWVAARKLTVKSQAVQGHVAPAADSPVVMRFKSGDAFDGDEMVDAGHLVGCHGRWAQVEYIDSALSPPVREDLVVASTARARLPAGRFLVWVDQLCAIQETSCDGSDASK